MLLTKNIIKFKKFLIKIPKETKRVWDSSENRWGFRIIKKTQNSKKDNYS